MTYNCDNFRRFCKCEDSESVGLICLGSDRYPTIKTVADFNASRVSFDNQSERLREELFSLIDEQKASTETGVGAPEQDPSNVPMVREKSNSIPHTIFILDISRPNKSVLASDEGACIRRNYTIFSFIFVFIIQ